VYESAIIEAPIDRVWAAVKPVDFHFLKSVSKHSLLDKANANTVGGVREILYKDNTKQSLRLLELSEAQRFVTWDVIASLPALTYSSVIHTVKLRRVTEDNHTFVQFTSDYSKDANQDVILDSKYKKTEFFKDLASITENRASQFLRRVDFSKVTKLSAGQVEEAWATFDTDKNGSLDQGEIEQLVEAILVKIADQQNSVFAAVANLFDEQVALEKKEAKEDKKDKKKKKKDNPPPRPKKSPYKCSEESKNRSSLLLNNCSVVWTRTRTVKSTSRSLRFCSPAGSRRKSRRASAKPSCNSTTTSADHVRTRRVHAHFILIM